MVEIINKDSAADLATLAGHTAVDVETTMSTLTLAALLTYVKIGLNIQWHNNIVDGGFMLCLVYGDATLQEIDNNLTVSVVNPENGQTYRANQVDERRVIDWTVVPGNELANQTTGFVWEPRLPKKGIPCAKGDGFKFVAFNMNASLAMTDGPNLNAISKYIFAWMGQ